MIETYDYVINLRDYFSKPMIGAAATVNNSYRSMQKQQEHLNRSVDNFGNTVRRVFGTYLGYQAVNSIVKTNTEIQSLTNAISYINGGGEEAGKTFQFLGELTDKLGLDLISTYEGYKTLAGGMNGSSFTLAEQRNMFRQVSVAVSGMQLSSENAKGALIALGQIMSKGKVQAEELRGQLGERIPGAFGLAARAMGVTQAELNKMLETGKVTSEYFLPRFAAQLEKEFSGAIEQSSNSLQAFKNRIRNLKVEMAGMFSSATHNGTIIWYNILKQVHDILPKITDFLSEHGRTLLNIAAIIGSVVLAYKAAILFQGLLTTAMAAYRTAVFIITGLTHGWKVAQMALNVALTANHIGIIVAAIALLVTGLVLAWRKSEKFRGAILGVWYVIKHLATTIKTYVTDSIKNLLKRPWTVVAGHKISIGRQI
ncbi:MAG: tape measure protein [Bacteroidales bacterium]|nr:tape measure protein [Bacteroidales bacterium]